MRVFVAFELEHGLKSAMERISNKLSQFRSTVRWVRPERMHLTLKFIGEVDDTDAPRICDACATIAEKSAPFELAIDRCGYFPPKGRVRVIWCGPEQCPADLSHCAARSEASFESIGFAREARPYTAHMTIGRAKEDKTAGRLRDAIESLTVPRATQTTKSITVFQSELSPQGPSYTPLGRFSLTGDPCVQENQKQRHKT